MDNVIEQIEQAEQEKYQAQQAQEAGIIDKDTNFENFWSFTADWLFKQIINRPEQIICLFTGNRAGKNGRIGFQYVLRIMGMHPIEKRNMRPDKKVRIYRFASETLPTETEGGEVRNTQYPEFMKWLPKHLIKKDITVRRPALTLWDPQGGPDIYVEFVSFNQTTKAMAGVERESIWIDEGCSLEFYEEQIPRLITTRGDLIYTLTPAEYVGFEYDEFFERASVYIRTKAVRNRLKERYEKNILEIEYRDGEDIAILMAASEDNPTISVDQVEETYSLLSDQDTIDIRRYGLFRQASGQIFKDFDTRTHFISADKYFPDWIPHLWLHARGIDYHSKVPLAIGFLALSPYNEAFIYDEYNPSPEKFVTLEIAKVIANKSRDYKYKLNLVDPLAADKQTNTGLSPLDDLNRIFSQFRRDGICTGGYWQSWDTKSQRGREEIKNRLRNSRLCGKPFNNRQVKDGVTSYLPTLWILDNCHKVKESFKNWRWEEWANREAMLTKDEKNKPQQRFSHFPMVVEALFKHPAFSVGRYRDAFVPKRDAPQKNYFQAGVR